MRDVDQLVHECAREADAAEGSFTSSSGVASSISMHVSETATGERSFVPLLLQTCCGLPARLAAQTTKGGTHVQRAHARPARSHGRGQKRTPFALRDGDRLLQLFVLRLRLLVRLMFTALTAELLDLRVDLLGPADALFAMVVDCCCCCCSLGCCRE
jgi:hypothetical protein